MPVFAMTDDRWANACQLTTNVTSHVYSNDARDMFAQFAHDDVRYTGDSDEYRNEELETLSLDEVVALLRDEYTKTWWEVEDLDLLKAIASGQYGEAGDEEESVRKESHNILSRSN